LGISNLSTGLSLDRLEPATSVRTVETYSSNKDAERDSRGHDSPGGESPPQDSTEHDSTESDAAQNDVAQNDSAQNDSAQNGPANTDWLSRGSSAEQPASEGLERGREEQLRTFVSEPYIPAGPSRPGDEDGNANPQPAQKIDRLA
jgi:hypothetical protein